MQEEKENVLVVAIRISNGYKSTMLFPNESQKVEMMLQDLHVKSCKENVQILNTNCYVLIGLHRISARGGTLRLRIAS